MVAKVRLESEFRNEKFFNITHILNKKWYNFDFFAHIFIERSPSFIKGVGARVCCFLLFEPWVAFLGCTACQKSTKCATSTFSFETRYQKIQNGLSCTFFIALTRGQSAQQEDSWNCSSASEFEQLSWYGNDETIMNFWELSFLTIGGMQWNITV